MIEEIKIQKTFEAPVEEVWKIFTEADYIRQWWGPDKFTCPVAKVNVEVGKSSLVSMQAPAEFGGFTHYNLWTYTLVEPMKRLEYLQNLSDSEGNKQDPTGVNLPEDFPEDVETVITFHPSGSNRTEVTFTERADFGSMSFLARIGLEQCLEKAGKIL